MGVLTWLSRFFGGIIFGLGITVFVLVLVSSSLMTQLDNMENIVSDSVNDFIVNNADLLVEEMLDAQGLDWDDLEVACGSGEIEGDVCENLTLYQENPTLLLGTEEVAGQNEDLMNQLEPMVRELFAPVEMVDDNMFIFGIIMICCLCLGGLMIFFGVEKNMFKFFSKILFSITWACLGWALGLWFVAGMEASDFLGYLPVNGMSGAMIEFSLQLILDIVQPALDPLVMPLLVVGLVALGLSVGLLIYGWVKGRKAKKK
tara:strand:+ start:837 stop:1613 length:777 start_codon:yes stop_codon:yes gene_type:complete